MHRECLAKTCDSGRTLCIWNAWLKRVIVAGLYAYGMFVENVIVVGLYAYEMLGENVQ